MSAIRVHPVRDQLVFGKDGQLESEQLSQRVERGETECGGGGGECEAYEQLGVERSGGRSVTDGHDLWEEVERVDCIERVHEHHPCREEIGEVGEGERRTGDAEVVQGRLSSRGALGFGVRRRVIEFLLKLFRGFGLRGYDGKAYSNGRDGEPNRLGYSFC